VCVASYILQNEMQMRVLIMSLCVQSWDIDVDALFGITASGWTNVQ